MCIMESDPIRPTRAREGIYREGTNVPPLGRPKWGPRTPSGAIELPYKGIPGPQADPIWTKSDPKMVQKWSFLGVRTSGFGQIHVTKT